MANCGNVTVSQRPLRRGIVPSYNDFSLDICHDVNGELRKIAEFEVKTHALGFRGIKVLGWLLHLAPHITGGRPNFRLTVRRLYKESSDSFTVGLSRLAYEQSSIIALSRVKGDYYQECFKDLPIARSGEFIYTVAIQVGLDSNSGAVVTFSALTQESVTLTLAPAIFAALGAILGVIVGYFIGSK